MRVDGVGGGKVSQADRRYRPVHPEKQEVNSSAVKVTISQQGMQMAAEAAGLKPEKAQPEEKNRVAEDWWQHLLALGKQIWHKIWDADVSEAEAAAAADLVEPAIKKEQTESSYYAPVENAGIEKQRLWERIKVKFHSLAGELLGRFTQGNFFQAGQDKQKKEQKQEE